MGIVINVDFKAKRLATREEMIVRLKESIVRVNGLFSQLKTLKGESK